MSGNIIKLTLISIFLTYAIATHLHSQTFEEIEEQMNNDTFNNPNAFCDLIVEHGLCLYNGEKRIFAEARPNGLIAHISFDDDAGLDDSGCMNNALGKYASGPAIGGIGYSAAFNGTNYLQIPNSHWFDSGVFSLTFWIFLTAEIYEDPTTNTGLRYCPLLYKGYENDANALYERAPAIYIDRELRKLTVYVTTTAQGTYPQGESVTSNGMIPYQKWTHVALVRLDKKLKLYLNGILDSVNSTVGSTVPNQKPFYIGNTPWSTGECAVPMFFDNLRFYTRELGDNEIQAEAALALGYVQSNFIVLGCMNCPLKEAAQTCIVGYHLCTNIEIHSAGFQIARALGWSTWDGNIWTYNALNTTAYDNGSVGLGLCCINQ